MNLITAASMGVRMGGRTLLSGVDFAIARGEIVTVVGPNGSGKSTLLRALLGAVDVTSGTVQRTPGLRIGYVPQKLHIDPSLPMTVMRFLNLPTRVTRARGQEALDQAGVPEIAQRQMTDLSGGQFQRVLLARALLCDPDVLVLDEATQGLDQPGSASFYNQIADVREKLGCAVLMVSHELHVVMAASDRVICLNGHILLRRCPGTGGICTRVSGAVWNRHGRCACALSP